MGASRAQKELYFAKLKELVAKYRKYTRLNALTFPSGPYNCILQPPSSSSMSTTLVLTKCTRFVSPSVARVSS